MDISVNRRIVLIGGAPFLFLLPPARETRLNLISPAGCFFGKSESMTPSSTRGSFSSKQIRRNYSADSSLDI